MALPEFPGVGRLMADPEIRFTTGGKAVARLRLVFSASKKDASGKWVPDGELYINATAWEALAENVAESFKEGDDVVVMLRKVQQRKYQAKDGSERVSLEATVAAIGPSLRLHPASLSRAERQAAPANPAAVDDPFASLGEAPF